MTRDYPARPSRRQGRGERYAEGRERHGEGRGGQRQEPSYRLFIAVEIPAAAVGGLAVWQQKYLVADPALRMTPEAQLHVTLMFLGQMGEHKRSLAAARLDELTQRRAFEVTCTGFVGLPEGRRSPRVIAARCEEPTGRLKAMQAELAAALAAGGLYRQEKRPYLPHVTIARARGQTRFDPSAATPVPVKFTAVRVTLYNSVLKAEGALHEALESVQLT